MLKHELMKINLFVWPQFKMHSNEYNRETEKLQTNTLKKLN